MLFNQIIGQHAVKTRLLQTVKDGRISHAQLFLGSEGTGALALAIAYAQYIACTNKHEHDACGECSSCVKFNKLAHPDLHFAYPVNTTTKISKDPISINFITEWRQAILANPYLGLFDWLDFMGIDNKQGIISAKESDDIIRKLSFKPYESEYKFMIIWMPEKMNAACANKLLKQLEEPPDKTLFLLVAEQQEQLLPTIISRTQLVKVKPIEDADLKTDLMFNYQLSVEQAQEVVNMAEGNYTLAVKLAQEAEGDSDSLFMQLFREWMLLCYNKKTIELVGFIDQLDALKREKQKKFLTYCLHLFRESLMIAYTNGEVNRAIGTEKDFLQKFYTRIVGQDIIEIIEEFNTAIYHIERNAHPKILFMDVSLKLFKWFARQNKVLAE